MEWTNALELSFLEHYQMLPVLWDPQDKFHKDKKKLSDAWSRYQCRDEYFGGRIEEKERFFDGNVPRARQEDKKIRAVWRWNK